jgi:glutamyl-tRNA synthetase
MSSNFNKTRCRFAPSPTGYLHVGNIRAAIINYLYKIKTNGEFILRFDDTDVERTLDEYRKMIITDMNWLNLKYDQFFKQSTRLDIYKKAKNYLIKTGRLYECYESQAELNIQRKSTIASGQAPIYNRASLNLTTEQKQNYESQGIKPYYRFLLKDGSVSWNDKIKGRISYEGRHFSDPVLIRENNVPTYTFCSVVDDFDFKITDIIRGEDHITNTAIQIQIFEALQPLYSDVQIPEFSHLALIKAKESKISKREGGFDIKSLREAGFEPLAIINLLAQIGTSQAIKIYDDINQLAENFDFSNFSKSATNYDLSELENINQKLLASLDFSKIQERLKAIDFCKEIDEIFWQAVKANITFLHEVKKWYNICKKDFHFKHDQQDLEFLNLAANLLPLDTAAANCWEIWLDKIKSSSNRKGKDLFMPIRLALTGEQHGPELKYLVNLISREQIIARLN